MRYSFYFIGLALLATCFAYPGDMQFGEMITNNTVQLAAGGKTVSLGDLPYAVVVIASTGKCTGSIIHDSWVLTAGHCVTDHKGRLMKYSEIKVIAGVIDFKLPGPEAQSREALKIVVHPEYKFNQLGKFDVALIEVKPFSLNRFVRTIGFSSREWPQDGRKLKRSCTSAGWGMLQNRMTTSVLHSQQVTAKHGRGSCPCVPKDFLMKRLICLEDEPSIGICFGDSGGALICDGEIAGVAHMVMDKRSCSYFKSPESTILCESSHVHGIYIYTCPLLDWIRKYVPNVSNNPASCKGAISSPGFTLIVLISVVPVLNKIYRLICYS